MIKMIVELAVVIVSMALAAIHLEKHPVKTKKTFAISFVLAFAVIGAFTLAQFSTQLQLLDIDLAYTPLDMLSLFAAIYWISFLSAKGTLFDKLIGE